MNGAELIAAERTRQKEVEGWTAEHDDEHANGELALAAICYGAPRKIYAADYNADSIEFSDPWPWPGEHCDKRAEYGECRDGEPHYGANYAPNPETYSVVERIDLLVKGAAMFCAEIDRLQRIQEAKSDA